MTETETETLIAALDTIIESYTTEVLDRLDAVLDIIGRDEQIHADYGETILTSKIRRANLVQTVTQIRTFVELVAGQAPNVRRAFDAIEKAERRESMNGG